MCCNRTPSERDEELYRRGNIFAEAACNPGHVSPMRPYKFPESGAGSKDFRPFLLKNDDKNHPKPGPAKNHRDSEKAALGHWFNCTLRTIQGTFCLDGLDQILTTLRGSERI